MSIQVLLLVKLSGFQGKRCLYLAERVHLKHLCTRGYGKWCLKVQISHLIYRYNNRGSFYGESRIEDTLRRITGFPAEWLGITDRGVIKERSK